MNSDLKAAAGAARNAKSLDDLRDAMIAYEAAWQAADEDTRYADEIGDWNDLAEGIAEPSDYYKGDDRDDLVAYDRMRMLVRSDNPDDDGFAIEDRDDIIFPLGGWRHDAKREEYWSVIAGLDLDLKVWQDGHWQFTVERNGKKMAASHDDAMIYRTAQDAADEAVEKVVEWVLKEARPSELLGHIRTTEREAKQAELALVLGVTQASISDWSNDVPKAAMSRAVRTHILRMRGITRADRRWSFEWCPPK